MGAGATRANGAMFSPMDSKKRPSVLQRKQILAGGAFGAAKREPDVEVRASLPSLLLVCLRLCIFMCVFDRAIARFGVE